MKIFLLLILSLLVHGKTLNVTNPETISCDYGNQFYKCGLSLACNNNTCSTCDILKDHCFDYPNFYCFPHSSDLKNNECIHRNLFPLISNHDIFATLLCMGGAALAATSGVGGGGLFIPILLTIGEYTPQMATAISSVTIFGASIASVFVYALQKHPVAKRPLIDFDVAVLLAPIILSGTSIGVIFNIIFPNWLTITLLFLMLVFTAVRSANKGIKLFIEETREKSKYGINMDLISEENTIVINSDDDKVIQQPETNLINEAVDEEVEYFERDSLDILEDEINGTAKLIEFQQEDILDNGDVQSELFKILKEEEVRFPLTKLLFLLFSWSILVFFSFLKGGKGKSIIGVKACSPSYWFLGIVIFPILFLFSFGFSMYLRMKHTNKMQLNYQFQKGDIHWTTKNAFFIPIFCLSAGILGGLLGLGGGMITGPIFLEMGLLPQIATSTSSLIIFVSVSSTTIQYAIFKIIPADYAVWFGLAGFFGALIGQFSSKILPKNLQRPSFLILLLALIVLLSSISMGIVGIIRVFSDVQRGSYLGFKSIC